MEKVKSNRGRKNLSSNRDTYTHKDIIDEEYVGSLQEKIDYDCEVDAAIEMEAALEAYDFEPPSPWERNL